MGQVTLMGWDADAGVWRKVLVNGDGKLIIDPSEIFEDPPTDGETGKAPNSNWAYDHNANASAHHAKYTDAEARIAIGDLLNSSGVMLKDLDANYFKIAKLFGFTLRYSNASSHTVYLYSSLNSGIMRFFATGIGGANVATFLDVSNGTAYERVAVEPVVDDKIADHAVDAGAHTALDNLAVTNTLSAGNGASGTFTTADGKTVTVTAGIITSIV